MQDVAFVSKEEKEWIDLALGQIAYDIPYAFPPQVDKKPIVRIGKSSSSGNKLVVVSFVPRNQLYTTANVIFDYNTKERLSVFATKGGLEKAGISVSVNDEEELCRDGNKDLKELKEKNITFEELRRLSTLGDPDAYYKLGLAYQNGRLGLKIDLKLACDYYQRAAKKGHEGAIRRLSVLDEKEKENNNWWDMKLY